MQGALKTLLISLAALTGVQLFAGNLSSSELLFNALATSKISDRITLCLRAAEADLENATVPLGVLLKQSVPNDLSAELCRTYDKFWKKHPLNSAVATAGTALYSRHKLGAQAILNNLKLNPGVWKEDGSELNLIRLCMHFLSADNKGAMLFASKLDENVYSFSLSSFYNAMAYRLLVMGDEDGSRKMTELRNKVTDIWISSRKNDPHYLIETMEPAAKDDNHYIVLAIYKELEKSLTDPRSLDTLRYQFAQLTPYYDEAEQAIAKNKSIPKEGKHFLLFYAAIKAKNFDKAMQLLKGVPKEQYNAALRDIALTFRKKELFQQILGSGKTPDDILGHVMLDASLVTSDKKLYYSAREILRQQKLTPDLANSIGYAAVMLGVDTQEAGELLKFAVSSKPASSAYLDSLAMWNFRQQLYAEAQKLIDLAIASIRPGTPAATILEHAGDICRAQGNFYEAEKFYRRALQFSSDDPECDPAIIEKKLREFK